MIPRFMGYEAATPMILYCCCCDEIECLFECFENRDGLYSQCVYDLQAATLHLTMTSSVTVLIENPGHIMQAT